jgi:predicted transcriptional regulator of viral defense system
MSTVKQNTALARFAQIASLKEQVFHINDLANPWEIKNKNTLHITVSRYVKQGLLFRIYRGFYSLIPPEKIDKNLLGIKAIHGYAYLSCETVLVNAGIIQQDIQYTTFISSQSNRFSIANNN